MPTTPYSPGGGTTAHSVLTPNNKPVRQQVRSLTAFESKSMVNNKDYVLVDVRPAEQFATRHPRGAVNVPLFMPAQVS